MKMIKKIHKKMRAEQYKKKKFENFRELRGVSEDKIKNFIRFKFGSNRKAIHWYFFNYGQYKVKYNHSLFDVNKMSLNYIDKMIVRKHIKFLYYNMLIQIRKDFRMEI